MSRKRLSRTVIEGGRVGSNKWERRHSHRTVRANERAYMADLNKNVDAVDEISIEPKEHVYKEFKDKLSPMYRWLRSQTGRPWADVRSEVAEKFDTRTTAGRHIVHDHLLKSVEEVPDLHYRRYSYKPEDWTTSYREYEFYVDDDGLLREKTVIKRTHTKPPKFDTKQIANWLSGRIVGKVGNKFFWFVPADKNEKRGGHAKEWMTEWASSYHWLIFRYHRYTPVYKIDPNGGYVLDDQGNKVVKEYTETWPYAVPNAFRQDRKLNAKELAFWNTIPEWYQTVVLQKSPTYPNPPKRDRWAYSGYSDIPRYYY